ncbi:hypothetical protein CYLTODRAFT_412820 [Cylindrobasidium torrendii FP15055 ss-10]|uniref:Uncharacterized protein n=1 Tax=Cylindrobasidium torrendii FP15055 ss-10 TaxID=1314674 RepID=A0A0D7B3F7_9AGAR|nr:hypothetical protein CYLTODRAFT_412820 [Cylindrobasidium torrendii FP15055 ss-10]
MASVPTAGRVSSLRLLLGPPVYSQHCRGNQRTQKKRKKSQKPRSGEPGRTLQKLGDHYRHRNLKEISGCQECLFASRSIRLQWTISPDGTLKVFHCTLPHSFIALLWEPTPSLARKAIAFIDNDNDTQALNRWRWRMAKNDSNDSLRSARLRQNEALPTFCGGVSPVDM